jgi:hypothetical protein
MLANGCNSTASQGRTVDYPNQSLVAFNVVYNSGGGGIHVFSTANATVANNTTYNNGIDPAQTGWARSNIDVQCGAASTGFGAGTNKFFNNIAYALPTGSCGNGTNNLGSQEPFTIGGDGTYVDADAHSIGHNISFTVGTSCHTTDATSGNGVYQSPPNATWDCTANRCNTDPQFAGVGMTSHGDEMTPPSPLNFALNSGSPAIGLGAVQPFLSPQAVDVGACYHTLSSCP